MDLIGVRRDHDQFRSSATLYRSSARSAVAGMRQMETHLSDVSQGPFAPAQDHQRRTGAEGAAGRARPHLQPPLHPLSDRHGARRSFRDSSGGGNGRTYGTSLHHRQEPPPSLLCHCA
jgi:hypothetical protein